MKNLPSTGVPETTIGEVVSCVLVIPNVRRATAYLADNTIVKATAQRRVGKRDKSDTILVTLGAPNFVERRFIRLAKKAGEPFPVKKIQLQFWKKK